MFTFLSILYLCLSDVAAIVVIAKLVTLVEWRVSSSLIKELFSRLIFLGLCVGHGDAFPYKCLIDILNFLTLWVEIRSLLFFSANVTVEGLMVSASCLIPRRCLHWGGWKVGRSPA